MLTQVYDETEYIHSAVGLVRENIFTGSALTMITLMMFLHLGRERCCLPRWWRPVRWRRFTFRPGFLA